MSLQKIPRSKSELIKEGNLLPSLQKYKKIDNNSFPTVDRYNQYMSAKLDKAITSQQLISPNKQKNKLSLMVLSQKQVQGQSSKAVLSPINKINLERSTPKFISKSKSPQKRRHNHQRYIANERLSMQLNLPKSKARNDSLESDDSDIKQALLKQDKQLKVEPIVYLLKRNSEYNAINDKMNDSRAFMTENSMSGSRMSFRQNTTSFPMIPSHPVKQAPLYAQPKHEKYIRQKFVGEEAVNKFYSRYKNIEKIRQMEHFNLEFNPLTIILTILQTYNIPPKKMEIIKLKGDEAILDLKNCALGGGISIKAIAEIIQKVSIFQQVDLSYNQITPDLTDIIIPNLSKMKRINLAYNKIGRRGIQLLTEMFFNEDIDEDCELQQLNLESNNITDGSMGNFFVNLANMNELMVLNLSKNCLGNAAAQKLKQFFLEDSTLSELYLHWCELGTKATKTIFEGLTKNYGLRVLDLSWNQIGMDGIPAFVKFLKANKVLVHLDISYCQIDEKDTANIAKALKHNQTIYGLHYQGNAGFVDYKGHLHPLKKEQHQNPLSIRTDLIQRINSVNIIPSYYHKQIQSGVRNVCWICEGWSEKYFKIGKKQKQKGCFLHLDFEQYCGVLMHDMGSYYELLRMCPPTQIKLFYTKVTDKDKLVHIYNQITVGDVKVGQGAVLPQFRIDKKIFKGVTLEKMNRIEQPRYFGNIFNDEYITQTHCQPRSNDMRGQHLLVQKPPKKKKPKRPIKKPQLQKQIEVKKIPQKFDNVFDANNVGNGDSYESLIKKCVEFDMTHSKVPKIIKNPHQLDQVRNLLEKNYDLFQRIYYYLANNNPSSQGVYSINETRFQKFIDEQSYQTKRITKAKIRLKLVSCLSGVSKQGQIMWFYRPQFFQFLLRLAIEKWGTIIPARQGETQTQRIQRQKYPLSVSQCFAKMIKTLRKYEEKADSRKWRDEHLTSYDLSVVISSYSTFFELLYDKYAGTNQRNLNTQMKKKLLLDEFKIMFLQAHIRKTKEALKDLEIAYRTAKKLQVQDGISDTGVDYTQFLQVFCRFAEGQYLTPIGTEQNTLWQKDAIKINQIPLFLKVQKILKQFYLKNYDLHNKKYDMLFQHGLFPQEVGMLMNHYKSLYEGKQMVAKTFLSLNARMNTIQPKSNIMSLKELVEMVNVKAMQIREKNRLKILQVQAEQLRLEAEEKKKKKSDESSDQEEN